MALLVCGSFRMKTFLLFIICVLVSCSPLKRDPARPWRSYASSGVGSGDLIGLEATLTNELLQNHDRLLPPELDDALHALAGEIQLLCEGCRVESYIGASYEEEYRVIFPDGFRFNLLRDQRVIEMTADPIHVKDLKVHTKKLTEIILIAGRRQGLYPAKHTGGGHLHFDFKSFFQGDPALLRDFLVDSYNHQEIFRMFFGGQLDNAPTLLDLPQESQIAFRKLIEDFDREAFSMYVFITRLESEVYNRTATAHYTPAQKYQAISFIHALSGHETVEFRHVRPYQNGDQIEAIASALLARRNYLKSKREVEGHGVLLRAEREAQKLKGNLKKEWQEAIKFLEEAGLKKEKYLALFPHETLKTSIKELRFKSLEDQFNFLKQYIKWSPFDSPERITTLIREGLLRNFDPRQTQELLELILIQYQGSSDLPVLKKKLSPIARRSGLDLIQIEQMILQKENARVSCGRLMKSLL